MADGNRALARLYLDRFPHDEALVDEALAPRFRFHHLVEIEGRDAFREFMRGVSRAFPDFRGDLGRLQLARDDGAARRVTVPQGTLGQRA